MNLAKKKKLAMRTLGLGKDRIVFLKSRLDEAKDAITKQDIRDLIKSGAIIVKEKRGRKGVQRKKSRSTGNIRKKNKEKKREYAILTRKLRKYIKNRIIKGGLSKEKLADIRKKIRNREFKSIADLKGYVKDSKKLK